MVASLDDVVAKLEQIRVILAKIAHAVGGD